MSMWKRMTFKEFVAWCNQRACDGNWSMGTAMTCIGIVQEVRSHWFWMRELYWRKTYQEAVLKCYVNPTEEFIELKDMAARMVRLEKEP